MRRPDRRRSARTCVIAAVLAVLVAAPLSAASAEPGGGDRPTSPRRRGPRSARPPGRGRDPRHRGRADPGPARDRPAAAERRAGRLHAGDRGLQRRDLPAAAGPCRGTPRPSAGPTRAEPRSSSSAGRSRASPSAARRRPRRSVRSTPAVVGRPGRSCCRSTARGTTPPRALQADLDGWDATRAYAEVLREEADAARERRADAAAHGPRGAREAAEAAVADGRAAGGVDQRAHRRAGTRAGRGPGRVGATCHSSASRRWRGGRGGGSAGGRRGRRPTGGQPTRRAAQAQQRLPRRGASGGSGGSGGGSSGGSGGGARLAAPAPPPPPPSGAAAGAIAFAKAQLGEPYVYGADGPDSWDCSGLTSQAWAPPATRCRTGRWRSTPRRHRSRRPSCSRVTCVFWSNGSPSSIYHVAMYLGGGR